MAVRTLEKVQHRCTASTAIPHCTTADSCFSLLGLRLIDTVQHTTCPHGKVISVQMVSSYVIGIYKFVVLSSRFRQLWEGVLKLSCEGWPGASGEHHWHKSKKLTKGAHCGSYCQSCSDPHEIGCGVHYRPAAYLSCLFCRTVCAHSRHQAHMRTDMTLLNVMHQIPQIF